MDVVNDRLMTMFEGKCVKLTLKTSSFSGVVQRINPNKTLVLAEGEIIIQKQILFQFKSSPWN